MQHDADEKLDAKPEVFAPLGAFEQPNAFVPGPFYASADERMPELTEGIDPSVAGDKQDPSGMPFSVDRRDFMKLFSLSAVAGATACVRRPAERAVPYVNQPVDMVPGVANYYASTCSCCNSGCGIMVKTREGRPVKIEGNPEHPISQGGLCALGQAQIQGYYHPERIQGPQTRHFGNRLEKITWDAAYELIAQKLEGKKRVGILTGGATGNRLPFFKEVLKRMGSEDTKLYTWDANSLFTSLGKAYDLAFGFSDLPRIELSKAQMILGVASDFQDVGTSPVYFTKGFSQSHSFQNGRMGKFVQFESILSLTGAKADVRHPIPPGYETVTALLLVKALLKNPHSKGSANAKATIRDVIEAHDRFLTQSLSDMALEFSVFETLAQELLGQTSVVVAGGSAAFNDQHTLLQLAAICANVLVGAYGATIILDRGWLKNPLQLDDTDRFFKDASTLDALFVIDADPLFTMPGSWHVKETLAQIPLLISIQDFPNTLDELAHFILPNHHSLESWGDENTVDGFWSARQPAVRPTTDSRQAEDSLLWILANLKLSLPYADYRAYLFEKWHSVYQSIAPKVDYDTFFKGVLRRGFIGKLNTRNVGDLRNIQSSFSGFRAPSPGLKLIAPLDHRFQDGRGAHIPLLQEIGDGLTTITWDSWVALNPETIKKLGFKEKQLLDIETEAGSFKAGLYALPGLHPDAVVVPRGNGHEDIRSTISYKVGVNPLVAFPQGKDALTGQPITAHIPVKLSWSGAWYRLAAMQKHNDVANRKDVVKQLSLKDAKNKTKPADLDTVPDLFPKLPEVEHRWGMAIDLTKCNGCGACMAACAIENNVPQVGRDQIILGREMHWIRLDRYFYGEVNNPVVTFQPVMCQHCKHAPCEPVCPVFATTHDPQGLNAMTYNRCVGTRYCANACPYKVRRFNWWMHKWGEIGENPRSRNPRAMNPDVTVRTRGIMEKCSMCVGRLREGRHMAKEEGRALRDGEVKTACQQTCPADAIVFGNLNDPQSEIKSARTDPRAYLMLGGDPEIGHYGLKTLPSVSYLAKVLHEVPEWSGKGVYPDHHSGHSKESEHSVEHSG